jgi:transposase
VDTEDKVLSVKVPRAKQRRRTIQERRGIVEETLQVGASVSRVARQHDVNANQVFYWRKLYREGRLEGRAATRLLPVKVTEDQPAEAVKSDGPVARLGTMEIEFPKGTLRIAGPVDVVALRAVLECLAR